MRVFKNQLYCLLMRPVTLALLRLRLPLPALVGILVAVNGCSNPPSSQASKTWNCGTGAFWIYSVTPTPDEKYLILGTAAISARIWDVQSSREVAILQDCGDVAGVAVSPSGDQIALRCPDHNQLVILDFAELRTRFGDQSKPIVFHALQDKNCRIIDFPGGFGPTVYPSDGKTFAIESQDDLSIYNVKDWSLISKTRVGVGRKNFNSEGSYFVISGPDKTIKVLGVGKHDRTNTISGLLDTAISISLSHDGRFLAIAYEHSSVVQIWERDGGHFALKTSFTDNDRGTPVRAMAFSTDCNTLATTADDRSGHLRLWDARTGKLNIDYSGHRDQVTCIVYLTKSNQFVTGSLDATVKFWANVRMASR